MAAAVMGTKKGCEFAMMSIRFPAMILAIIGLLCAPAWAEPVEPARMAVSDSAHLAAIDPVAAPTADPILGPTNDPTSENISGVSDGNAVRAVVRSVQNVTIGSELNARITAMPFRDGDNFEKGDVLVTFDCARTNAERDAAVAIHKSQKLAYAKLVELKKYEAAGSFAVDQARFEMDKAAADVAGLEAKRETCTITAPFRGRVVEKMAQAHEVAQANQPLMKIVEGSAQELVLMVPSNWLPVAGIGHQFSVRLDETGQTYNAKVTQVGGAIDPISQSVRMIGELATPSASVAPGMSGTATFSFAGGNR
jgi:membrane fusion protein, multidrug efflux system